MPRRPKEREIEAAFVEFMKGWKLNEPGEPDAAHWIKRQVDMPFEGRADIVAIGEVTNYVVEVKRGRISGKAVAQLLGYQGQIETVGSIAATRRGYARLEPARVVDGILVGKRISNMAARAAAANDIGVYTYETDGGAIVFSRMALRFSLGEAEFTDRFLATLAENIVDVDLDWLEVQEQLDDIIY